MKNQANAPAVGTGKVLSITLLFAVSIGIILLGASFSILSVIYDFSFTVLSSQIHGVIFGVVIMFLGIRYFFSVRKLKAEVYKESSRFSWSNFRKEKTRKSLSASR